ncbi:SAM-dependent methyltransferase [Asanoa sp. WMMD1127]|uniref:SAM-dependent methyltransferase n=1 Tax=Asanoa sp. WMMD1127 TaxID=3016107 RepID=UPI0024163AA7|nr:SAM-dependent methyltransferase [Asanoa sp. WMMD1127]MDG4822008.1 SAM-dependent methyltransferase [Asanoa sp. WMMD1127]
MADGGSSWSPAEIDRDKPNAARVYDYYLGGAHNFAADRTMAEQAMADWPELPALMRANRAFLRRVTRFMVRCGIRQFLDLGAGLPTAGSVVETAQAVEPSCRVVCVDIDPVAVIHARAMLADTPLVTVLQGDLRDPAAVLAQAPFDPSAPVGVLLVAVLHFVPDADDPAGIMAGYRDAVSPGSMFAVTHATADAQPTRAATHQQLYRRTATPMTMRTRAEVTALFAGLELVPPGVVDMTRWQPDADADQSLVLAGYGAVGLKP